MLKGSEWEVRLLRIASIGLLVILSIAGIEQLLNLGGSRTALTIRLLSLSLCWFLALFTVIKVTSANYPKLLLFFIVGVHFFITLFFVGADYDGLQLPYEQRIGEGRWVDYIFHSFPATAVGALAFLRLWAVVLWIVLSTATIVRTLWAIFLNPQIYLESDWNTILTDGFAVNAWMLKNNIMSQIFLCVIILAIFFFNKKLVASAVSSAKSAEAFGRYFSPEIRDEIQSSGEKGLDQSPKDLEVAVMFTDLVGFTNLSENMKPKEVLKLLSDYQSLMVEAIFECKGTVDKFIGDAVMANFGTPKSHGNDAQNAFDCAILMNKKLSEWNKTREDDGLPKITHRIGIHYGPCVVGNMGSEQRVEFAIIGDVVNVASRICDACKKFDTNFLVSSDLAQRINILNRQETVSNFVIRGRSEPIDLVKIY